MTRRSPVRAVLLIPIVLAGGTLAACGSDDDPAEFRQSSFGSVLSFSAAGPDDLFALTDARRTCPTCVTLWQWNRVTGEWARMHDFPKPAEGTTSGGRPPVGREALTMAPDAVHGWIRWQGDPVLLETEDGGGTWAAAPVPWGRAQVVRMQADADHVLATVSGDCATAPCSDDVWRTTIGSDSWRLVGAADTAIPTESGGAQTGPVFATADVAHRVDESGRLLRSDDGGRSWHPLTG